MTMKVICVLTAKRTTLFIHVRNAPNFEGNEGYVASGKNTPRLLTIYQMLWSNHVALATTFGILVACTPDVRSLAIP
jgi:hypothetical protein